jgi:hypothetical protein
LHTASSDAAISCIVGAHPAQASPATTTIAILSMVFPFSRLLAADEHSTAFAQN